MRTVWAKVEGGRRLYLIDEGCDFVEPVKLYLDHIAALEKSPNTLENYCRHLGRFFAFLRREEIDYSSLLGWEVSHRRTLVVGMLIGAVAERAVEHLSRTVL